MWHIAISRNVCVCTYIRTDCERFVRTYLLPPRISKGDAYVRRLLVEQVGLLPCW